MVVMEILYVFNSYIFHYFEKSFISLLNGGIHTKFASSATGPIFLPENPSTTTTILLIILMTILNYPILK